MIASSAWALESYSGFHPANKNQEPGLTINPAAKPLPPNYILDSPGRVVGTTYFDYQTNGSTGNRIALDFLGGVHFCWTRSTDPSLSSRNIYYGFISETGDSLPPIQLAGQNRAGFAGLDILNGSIDPGVRNSVVVGYHSSSAPDDRFATDMGRGLGLFGVDSTGFPVFPDESVWPYFSIDFNDNIQAVATQSNIADGGLREHIYSRRPYGSVQWTPSVVFAATYNISPVVTSSPITSKSAIVWSAPKFQDSSQYDNDVVFVESSNGTSWNFGNGEINITNYPAIARGDTVPRAYTDLDAVYDYQDNLHIIWNAPRLTKDASNQTMVLYHTSLYHWSSATGITQIYDHPSRQWQSDMGAWNLPIAKMSIGVDADSNFLYVLFTRYDPSDYSNFDTLNLDPNPCGGDNAMPCANGELYLTWSRDGGLNWAAPINITNTPSPNCLAGNCDNDNWSSLAELVGDHLHIIYIDDKDAGAATVSEGEPTENPVIYLRYPNPARSLGGDCHYVIGDVNNSGVANGVDVIYGVNFLKGGNVPPVSCDCPPHGVIFPAGDVNGNCAFNGIDVSYFVNYLKGGPLLAGCPDCPPSR